MITNLFFERPRAQRFAAVFLFAAFVLSSLNGHAQTVDTDEIRRLRREAYQALGDDRLMDAYKILSQLFAASGWLWDACNAGRVAYRLGKLPEAYRYLSECEELGQKTDPKNLNPKDKRLLNEARNDRALVRTQVARLMIYVSKPGAELFVDGSKIGMSPFHKEIGLEPGVHRVKAVLGDASTEREYKLGVGEERIADLILPDPPPFEAPFPPAKTESGKTEAVKTGPVKTEPSKTAPLPASPVIAAPRQWPSFLLVTAGVVGLVGASFTAASFPVAMSEYGHMQKNVAAVRTTGCTERPACDKFHDAGAAGDTALAVGEASIVICTLVGSGLAAAGVIGLVTDPGGRPSDKPAPTKDAPVKVEAAPALGGVVIRATF